MEILDLYDRERIRTNETIVRGSTVPKDRYHLVIHICIFNHKGEMLIQKRSNSKANWPGLWDVSVGGAVQQGNHSWQQAQLELREELGLNYDFSQVRPSLTVNFEFGFDDFYLLNMDPELRSLHLQAEEVDEVMWASKEKILKMMEEGSFLNYQPSLISTLFAMRFQMGVLVK